MPACGVAVSTDRWGPASLEHGTDDEPAQGSDQGDGEDVMVALRKVWAVMDAPAGKGDGAVPAGDRGPAAGLSRAGRPGRDRREVVRIVGSHDRPPAGFGERKRLELKGRSGTKPGSLLKSAISI